VSPLKAPTGPKLAISANPSGNYLVLLKGNGIPKGFAEAVADLGGTVTSAHGGAGFATVSGLSAGAAAQLGRTSGVGDIQEDAEFAFDAPIETINADVTDLMSDPSIESQGNPATAILGSWQWNMRLIGADAAWAGPTPHLGSSTVRVAILDTGIDYDNRDFFRAATATVPEARLVDLSTSASFVPSDEDIRTALFPTRNAISDFHGHGTNVATQVSSLAFAFAGVTSQTTLVGVKVLSARGSGSTGGVLNGVLWAADHNVDVANMSLGSEFSKAGNGRFLSLINRVFNYAKQKGMLIVVAAGNAHDPDPPIDIQHNGNQFVSFWAHRSEWLRRYTGVLQQLWQVENHRGSSWRQRWSHRLGVAVGRREYVIRLVFLQQAAGEFLDGRRAIKDRVSEWSVCYRWGRNQPSRAARCRSRCAARGEVRSRPARDDQALDRAVVRSD
jgi:hypothetical protein